ncbi:MAG: hypothetical protein AAGJ97_13635, partial [Planctomycetota bacterium]
MNAGRITTAVLIALSLCAVRAEAAEPVTITGLHDGVGFRVNSFWGLMYMTRYIGESSADERNVCLESHSPAGVAENDEAFLITSGFPNLRAYIDREPNEEPRVGFGPPPDDLSDHALVASVTEAGLTDLAVDGVRIVAVDARDPDTADRAVRGVGGRVDALVVQGFDRSEDADFAWLPGLVTETTPSLVIVPRPTVNGEERPARLPAVFARVAADGEVRSKTGTVTLVAGSRLPTVVVSLNLAFDEPIRNAESVRDMFVINDQIEAAAGELFRTFAPLSADQLNWR